MLRLNKLTDYAVVTLTRMAGAPGETFTTPRLAGETAVPIPTVAKLMKQLSKGGLVSSQRGATGGYMLGRPPEQITVAEVIEVMEGPISLTACVEGADDSCSVVALCPMSGNWNKVNSVIHEALKGLTLADMMPEEIDFVALAELSEGTARKRADAR